jgi:hypothetical protein
MTNQQLLQHILQHPTIAARLTGQRTRSGEEIAWCIFHPDGDGKAPHDPNLRLGEPGYYCHACKAKGSLRDLAQHLGIGHDGDGGAPVSTWDYYAAAGGGPLYQKCRFETPRGKSYLLRRAAPDNWQDCPHRGECQQERRDCHRGWIWSLKGKTCSPAVPPMLYNLPMLVSLPDAPVYVAEGEKCCDALGELDLLAVCNPHGAGEWRSEYSEGLQGREVVILPDADTPGRDHAQKMAESLCGKATSLKIVDLYPDHTDGSDIADWIAERRAASQDDGSIRAELEGLIAQTPMVARTSSSSPAYRGSDSDDDESRGPVELCTLTWPGPRRWIVEGWVPANASTVLYGDGGMAKSLQALLMGECVARGQQLFGREVQQGRVLYLDWELDREEQTRRAHRVASGLGYTTPAPGLYYRQMAWPLGRALPQIAAWIGNLGLVLVIIDSFGLATLGDPTTARDVVPLLAGVSRLPCTCLFIDHVRNLQPGETGDDLKPFGSVYKFNIARSVIRVVRVGGDDVSLSLAVRQTKSNFGPLSEPLGLRVTFEEERICFEQVASSPGSAHAARPRAGLEKVSQALLTLRQASPEQLAEATNLSTGTVKNKLTELRKLGVAAPVTRGLWAPTDSSSSPSLPPSRDDDDDVRSTGGK